MSEGIGLLRAATAAFAPALPQAVAANCDEDACHRSIHQFKRSHVWPFEHELSLSRHDMSIDLEPLAYPHQERGSRAAETMTQWHPSCLSIDLCRWRVRFT